MEETDRFELSIAVLQTTALPLGDVSLNIQINSIDYSKITGNFFYYKKLRGF